MSATNSIPSSATSRRAAFACVCLLACAALVMGGVGCSDSGADFMNLGGGYSGGSFQDIPDAATFHRVVRQSDRPVLVDFYKDSCPTCVIQEGELDQLAPEYAGRVRFVKFKIREATMQSANPEIMDEYNLFWVPTVVLFVNGHEKQRWVLNHLAMEFRGPLDQALVKAPARVAAAGPAQGPAGRSVPTESGQLAARKPAPSTPALSADALTKKPATSAPPGTECTAQGCRLVRPGQPAELGAWSQGNDK